MGSVKGGVKFVATQQLKSGSFRHSLKGKNKGGQTTVVPSLILLALADVAGSDVIKKRVAAYLLTQKTDEYSWNFWERAGKETKTTKRPDDLGATFLAATALWKYDEKLLSTTAVADLANLLFATETETGGPYRTWIGSEAADKSPHDVDIVVNSVVGYFLSLQGVSLPNLELLADKAISKQQFASSYCSSDMIAVYFLAKWYRGKYVSTLQQMIIDRQVLGVWESPLETAMAVSSLQGLGYPMHELDRAIEYLREHQTNEGGYDAEPVFLFQGQDGSGIIGASALTTALCLEVLSLQPLESEIEAKRAVALPEYESVIMEVGKAVTAAKQPELGSADTMLSKIITRDYDKQIVMLPYIVREAAKIDVPDRLLQQLAVASVWGWISYMIFDDFLDNEGKPVDLPSAIFAHRQLIMKLQGTLPDNAEFHQEVEAIFNRLVAANAWEVNHCRGIVKNGVFIAESLPDYGDYWQLADRSIGHMIAAIGVFYGAGETSKSPFIAGIKTFFKHYLIARQLNDDAQDWEKDLAVEHINAVGVKVIEKWLKKNRRTLAQGIDLKKDGKAMQLIMWEGVIDEVYKDIQLHAKAARQALKKAGIDREGIYLLPLLEPLERSVEAALSSRDQSMEFIASLKT